MVNEEKHYPGQQEAPEAPSPENPAPEPRKEPVEPEAPTKEPEADEPKDKADEEPEDKSPEPEQTPVKKRSIYDDLKDKKREAREAKSEAEAERARAEAAEARNAELEQLLKNREEATTDKEKEDAEDDIQEFLKQLEEEGGISAKGIEKLTGIIAKRVKSGDGLSAEDRALLEESRVERAARQREAEDADTRKAAPLVKKELNISDDAELQKVMDEIVRLSHTDEFHDKEPEYILWKNKASLSKLVSPKKPSFESGESRPDVEHEEKADFSGRVTPEQMTQELSRRGRTGGYEIRSSRRR